MKLRDIGPESEVKCRRMGPHVSRVRMRRVVFCFSEL